MYRVKKTYGHDLGWGCTFRQWRSKSHCSKVHGYALAITIEFESETLDLNNWCIDFGGLNTLKSQLADTFDHTTIIASDDPELETFKVLEEKKLINLRVMPQNSCEGFAKYIFDLTGTWLKTEKLHERVHVVSVEVKEHGSNSASYIPR